MGIWKAFFSHPRTHYLWKRSIKKNVSKKYRIPDKELNKLKWHFPLLHSGANGDAGEFVKSRIAHLSSVLNAIWPNLDNVYKNGLYHMRQYVKHFRRQGELSQEGCFELACDVYRNLKISKLLIAVDKKAHKLCFDENIKYRFSVKESPFVGIPAEILLRCFEECLPRCDVMLKAKRIRGELYLFEVIMHVRTSGKPYAFPRSSGIKRNYFIGCSPSDILNF